MPESAWKPVEEDKPDSSAWKPVELNSTGIAAPQGTSSMSGKDIATGIAQGAANTVGSTISGTSRLLNKIPVVGKYLAPEEGIRALEARTKDVSTPQNPVQSGARTAEQIGEWLLPTGFEGKAASVAPEILGRAGPMLARIGAGSLEAGVRNKTQGGDFGTGAEVGAGTGVLGEAGRAVAPAIAESALGIQKRMRGYGKTPGIAALEETTGIRPATVEKSAQERLGKLTGDIEQQAASHQGTIDLRPAIQNIDQEIAKASSQNNAKAVEQLTGVRKALTEHHASGLPIPADQPATNALNLKRGLRNQYVTNWNPETMKGTRAVAANASHTIDEGLDTALGPTFASKNQRISSLIPVAERAESMERGAGLPERVFHRIGAHTGALAGTLGGGAYGYNQEGIPGMLKYGTAGLVLPEVLSSPATRMAIARGLYHPMLPTSLLKGSALQFNRKPDDEK